MAETEQKRQELNNEEEKEEKLKYLDFVQVATLQVLICFGSIYDYAKENAGPLKPGVQTVEDTVKTVVGPVYDKFHHVPIELLKFVDRKVDNSVTELDRHVPNLLKQLSTQAYIVAQKAPGLAKSIASQIQTTGLIDTAKTIITDYEPTAKELFTKYEPVAESYAVSTWRKLNKLPLFPQVAHIVVPTAAYWTEKYNQTVIYTANKGFVVSNFLPIVPIDKICKIFGDEQSGSPVSSSASSSSSGDDDDHEVNNVDQTGEVSKE